LRLYRELDDAAGIASSLQVLGSVAREQGRYARSMELHRESLAIAEAAGDRWAVANAHDTLGFAAWLQGDFELATAECATALNISRELGYVEDIAWSLISLGAIARYQRAPERRRRCWPKAARCPSGSGSGRAWPGRWSSWASWRSIAATPRGRGPAAPQPPHPPRAA
jgi:hypothetical protein